MNKEGGRNKERENYRSSFRSLCPAEDAGHFSFSNRYNGLQIRNKIQLKR